MALTINTNMASLQAQNALTSSTSRLNTAMQRMTTGYKINSSKDDAAGLAVATKLETKLSAVSFAESNVELGNSLLSTLEGNYGVIQDHLQRIRDLAEQAANGTYSTDSRIAIQAEITQRLDEISRVSQTVEYNDLYLLNGSGTLSTNGLNLQVGITSSNNSVINIDKSLFSACVNSTLTWKRTGVKDADNNAVNMASMTMANFAKTCAGYGTETGFEGTKGANKAIAVIDAALKDISDRTTVLGSVQNRLDSAADALNVQNNNLTSSLSTVRDADVASESSKYIAAQILQQASATLLATANQTPSIALNLL